jgi:mono/diheme cytochrome c family protein
MSIRAIAFAASVFAAIAIAGSSNVIIGRARAETQAPEQRRMLIEGAHLWSVYCNQCHNARPGSQFSPAQWDAITMHMKTLSNMPAKDMRAIKEFLKLH